jgi:hypothetical protein
MAEALTLAVKQRVAVNPSEIGATGGKLSTDVGYSCA